MDPKRWQQIRELFDRAVELPSEEQEKFLGEACGDDDELLGEVRSLLEADAEIDGLLDEPAIEQFEHVFEKTWKGKRVGAYEITDRLGAGGMGVVYLAERVDGQFRRKVALKVIKKGMDSEEILGRFTHERRVLARLEHPNIARLIDAGLADTGQPYFTMEYVDGVPITDYCDQRKLTVDDRLDLFSTVCHAVQYAHQNLIVHRDIKPGNIMVTDEGTVKLLDFGIAKVLKADDTIETDHQFQTRTGHRILTPGYAAPEQVRGQLVSTATDVYALGVVLFQLLTGSRPEGPSSPGTGAMRPSDVVSSHQRERSTKEPAEDISDIYRSRRTEPDKLHRELAGDLDNICLMAMRDEAERRYSSAAQLREDIVRYRKRMPVLARPDTFGYRLRKFTSRHRSSLAGAAAVLILIAGLTAYYTSQLATERDRAQAEAAKAQEVSDYLISMFNAADPNESQGEQITARELLAQGANRIDKELADQPEIQATMYENIGHVYHQLGQLDTAGAYFRRALAIQKQLHFEPHHDFASLHHYLGVLNFDQGDLDSAVSHYETALEIFRAVYGENHPKIATVLNDHAITMRYAGDLEGAERQFKEALAMRRELLDPMDPDLAHTLNHLGRMYSLQGRLEEAVPLLAEGLEIRETYYDGEHFEIIASRGALAKTYFDLGELDKAEELFRANVVSMTKLVGEDHHYAGAVRSGLARVLTERGQLAQADPIYREGLQILKAQLPPDHVSHTTLLCGLAYNLILQGREKEAEPLLRRALAIRLATYPPGSLELANPRALLGHCLALQRRFDEAEPLLAAADSMYMAGYGQEHYLTQRTREFIRAMQERMSAAQHPVSSSQ